MPRRNQNPPENSAARNQTFALTPATARAAPARLLGAHFPVRLPLQVGKGFANEKQRTGDEDALGEA